MIARVFRVVLCASAFVLLMEAEESLAARCVVVKSQGGTESFVNSCGGCRSIYVQRSRPGGGVPSSRQIDIQAGTVFPSPFRGPGRSRIRSDRPCPGTHGGSTDLMQSLKKDNPRREEACVSLEQNQVFGVVLVNRCGTCKAVAIERWSGNSSARVRDYVEVNGTKSQPLPSRGFTQVGLLGEIDCRS